VPRVVPRPTLPVPAARPGATRKKLSTKRFSHGEPENVLLVSLLVREAFDTLLEAKVLIER